MCIISGVCHNICLRYIKFSESVMSLSKVTFGVFTMYLLSYYNLSSVTIFVCPLTTQPFMDLQAPNLAGRSGAGTKNTSRKRNFKIRNGCHGNQEILPRLRYWSDGVESSMMEPP